MQYLNTMCFKILNFTVLSMVIGSCKAWADLPLPMVGSTSSFVTETGQILLSNDSILWIGFLLWIGYVVFFSSKDTLIKS